MTAVLPPGLLPLLGLANFAAGMGAFVVVGVLSPVARDLGLTPAAAGWLMTAYAIVIAVASPVLIALSGARDRARLLVAGLALLGAGALAGALAPGFWPLVGARIVMALGGALIGPVTAAITVALVPPEQRGRALATVFVGLTLSQALGIPVGAWLGYALGWRAAFASVAALALVAALVLARRAPRGLASQPASLAVLGRVLVTPHLLAALAFTLLFMGAAFTLYTYLAPFLEARHGLGREGVTAMLLVFGLGAIVGNTLGGRLTDRIGAGRTLALLCLAQLALMPALTLLHLPVLATGALIGLWSIAGWSSHVAQQARLAALDPARAGVLLALHSSGIYVGGSLGATAGGWALTHGGPDALGPAGAALVLLALLSVGAAAALTRPAPARAAL